MTEDLIEPKYIEEIFRWVILNEAENWIDLALAHIYIDTQVMALFDDCEYHNDSLGG